MRQLGGESIVLGQQDVGLGQREWVADVARALSGYVDVIAARTYRHQTVMELAQYASVPVINGLTDREHPCQVIADLLTIQEHFGELNGRTLTYVGDGNNVASSLLLVGPLVGMNVAVASPVGYAPSAEILRQASDLAAEHGTWVELGHTPETLVKTADVIYADAWYSMGQEHEAQVRQSVFRPFQVNDRLMRQAPAHAMAMHCLPAHRGDEITDEVLDGARSLAFQQAANRLPAQKAILLCVLDL